MEFDHVLIAGVPLILVIPALVESMKRAGLPDRYAGLAAIACGIVLFALGELTVSGAHGWATWIVGGIIYGLAASGLYSQRRQFTRESER